MAASSIYFNGRVTWKPGSYSEVDASALARPGLGASGIIACLGEAEGGAPYSETGDSGIHRISNPGKVARTFRQGDLLECGNIMFDPSKDPDIPGGAQEVVFVKVNPATQSELTIPDDNALDNITFTSVNFGAFANYLAVEIDDGTDGGKKVTVYADYDGAVEEFDNLGADGWFSLALPASIYSGISSYLTFTASLAPSGVFAAAWALAALVPNDSGVATTGDIPGYESSGWDNPFTGPDTLDLVSDNVGDTTQSVTIYGINNATGQPASEVKALNGTTPGTTAITWSEVHGWVLDDDTAGTVTLKKTTGGTVLKTFSTAGATFAGLEAATDGQLEVNGGSLKFAADAACTDKVLVVGYATGGGATLEQVTLTGTTEVETTTTDWEWVAYVFTGNLTDARTITMSGAIWEDDTTAELVSDNATDTQDVILVGYDGSGTLATETKTLNGTSVVTSSTWDCLLGAVAADPSDIPVGNVTIRSSGSVLLLGGAGGDVTLGQLGGATAVAGAGFAVLMDLADDGILTYDLSSLTGSDLIVVGSATDGSAKVVKLTLGTTGTSTGWGHIAGVFLDKPTAAGGTVDALSFTPFSLTCADFDSLSAVEDWFDGFTGLAFTMLSGQPTAVSLEDADEVASEDLTATTPTFYGVHYDVIEGVNDQSAYVTAAAADGSDNLAPANRAKSFLSGGSEGTTTFADWQAALDKMKGYRINSVVPLTDNDAVHAATIAHCAYMAGPGRSERDCFLGAPSGTTLSEGKALALAMNTRHARLCIQDIERFNTDGDREQFPPYFTAAMAAGMQSGSPVGTSLTWKYVNVLDVIGDDASYTTRDDADELIRAGLLVIERVPNVGYRWVRNITTYLIDSNPAYTEGGVNEAVNYAVYEFRTALEAIVGKKAFAGTVAAAQGIATAILGQLVTAGVISAFRNLSISIDGDVMEVDVEIAPIQSVNFVKSTLHLVSASFANAA